MCFQPILAIMHTLYEFISQFHTESQACWSFHNFAHSQVWLSHCCKPHFLKKSSSWQDGDSVTSDWSEVLQGPVQKIFVTVDTYMLHIIYAHAQACIYVYACVKYHCLVLFMYLLFIFWYHPQNIHQWKLKYIIIHIARQIRKEHRPNAWLSQKINNGGKL